MMDNWCAPQWTDFTCSPQPQSDSYFEVEHEEHEPQLIIESTKYNVQQVKKAEVSLDSLEGDAKSNESAEFTATPVKTAFYVALDEEPVASSSTIGDLPEAMNKLQICAKGRKPILSSSLRQKTAITKKVASCGNSSKYAKPGKSEEANASLPKAISFGISESPKEIQGQAINKRLSYKIMRRRESNNFKAKRSSLGKGGPRVLASQHRRRSIKGRRRSNQFVSMAEAVSKFYSGTPERFRTVSAKDMKPAALTRVKRAPLKLTCPISPALRCNQRCKDRARAAGILSKEERELQELEEMKKNQIKANPVPANILKAPVPLKKVEKKPNTVTEEFKLTQPKTYRRTIMPLLSPKQAPINKAEHKHVASTISKKDSSMLSVISEKSEPVQDKVRPVDYRVSSPVQLKKTRHTMGPIHSPSKPSEKREEQKVTRAVPCSLAFETRTKEFLEKREQKLKTLQSQQTKAKAEFHARPVPKFCKAAVTPKEQTQKKTSVPCPFSFEERDKSLAKKKEEQVKQILEERGKTHHFHANPVPTFKPVAVHGLHTSTNNSSRIRDKSADRTKKPTRDEQENKPPNIIITPAEPMKIDDGLCSKLMANNHKPRILKPKAAELNTDKRAKDRQDFDEKLKQKELELETKKQEEEKARLAKEKEERALLRKKAEVKARPMPLYKPLQILKSTKPPTSPMSPAGWASKLKSKHVP